jgi:hypothetical protein
VTVLVVVAVLLLLAVGLQSGKKAPPRKLDEIERLRRYAERVRREEIFPFE